MMKLSSIARINLSIVAVCMTAVLFAKFIGLLPDERTIQAQNRAKLCESITSSISYSVARHDLRAAGKQLESFAAQNTDLLSVGLRRFDGDLVVDVGDHQNGWNNALAQKSDGVYLVPIANKEAKWGELELHFKPLYAGVNLFFSNSMFKLLAVIGLLVGGASWLNLRRMLRYLDPTRAVPPRVRDVLNSFAEGVVVLDENEKIVVVNDTFAGHVSKTRDELLGTKLWDLPWTDESARSVAQQGSQASQMRGAQLELTDASGRTISIFSVNSSPVLDDKEKPKGVMMAFNDITPLEQNRAALMSTLEDLSRSKKEIIQQNNELRYLATRDPLTSCINRRTFFEQFDAHWANAASNGIELCGLMVDIDFFKNINDSFGHSMGDEVLRQIGALLNEMARKEDVVCRYGGEEFAILMPNVSLEESEALAENIRTTISDLQFPDFTITASMGISAFSLGAEGPQNMLDQADKCLYVAKRHGRNQVVRFDTVSREMLLDDAKIERKKYTSNGSGPAIPYAAVTALVSALSFRDNQTGMHSTRVSNYAALLAQRIMSPRDVFVVEMAALLHDIGKIGVPDAILLKPGRLTEEEWVIMEKHDQIGVEIINRSFKHPSLTEIVKYHHYRYAESALGSQEHVGEDIPVGARILTIVDSFDAMVSDRPYRKGMPVADALKELRRCAGTQFDPNLVEQFAIIIESGCDFVEVATEEDYDNEVVLSIGEQVERLVDAADEGDSESFIALAEQLRSVAHEHNITSITSAATHAIDAASEDAQLDNLVKESLELLTVCRSMRKNISSTADCLL